MKVYTLEKGPFSLDFIFDLRVWGLQIAFFALAGFGLSLRVGPFMVAADYWQPEDEILKTAEAEKALELEP